MPSTPLSPPPTAPPVAARDAWAEVRSHDRVTRYRRSGAGRAVLLMGDASPADGGLWPGLADAFAARFRVIRPEPPAPGADIARWLDGFLEGLGSVNVALVAAEQFCLPALEIALRDAGQVARLLLVPAGDAGVSDPILEGALDTRAGRAVPVLIVRRGVEAETAIPIAMRFLDGCQEARPG